MSALMPLQDEEGGGISDRPEDQVGVGWGGVGWGHCWWIVHYTPGSWRAALLWVCAAMLLVSHCTHTVPVVHASNPSVVC